MFRVDFTRPEAVPEAIRFHQNHIAGNPHQVLRTSHQFKRLANDWCLYEVRHDKQIVAQCYIDIDDNGSCELGGAYVVARFRRNGLALAMGMASIANLVLNADPKPGSFWLKTFVHQENEQPRRLVELLGFERDGSDGVFDEFRFNMKNLTIIADWLENSPEAEFRLDLHSLQARPQAVADLRDIARRWPA